MKKKFIILVCGAVFYSAALASPSRNISSSPVDGVYKYHDESGAGEMELTISEGEPTKVAFVAQANNSWQSTSIVYESQADQERNSVGSDYSIYLVNGKKFKTFLFLNLNNLKAEQYRHPSFRLAGRPLHFTQMVPLSDVSVYDGESRLSIDNDSANVQLEITGESAKAMYEKMSAGSSPFKCTDLTAQGLGFKCVMPIL